MPDHQIVNPADHAALRVRTEAGAALGDGVMAALATPAEFMALACEYPILFRHDPATGSFSALALFGFEDGENLYLTSDGWDASLRPLSMAIQPFLVGRNSSGEGPGQVHIDMDHPRISRDGEGTLLFDDTGQPTPFLEDIAGKLGALDESYRASAAFYAAIDRHGLLEPFAMDVSLPGGSSHRLVGYHLVDQEKLAALEPGPLAELHSAGHLVPAIAAMTSLGNLAKLVKRKGDKSAA